MTPQQKAKEIVEKFEKLLEKDLPTYGRIRIIKSKQCAIIHVDEMIKYCHAEHIEYWQQIKTEIQKL